MIIIIIIFLFPVGISCVQLERERVNMRVPFRAFSVCTLATLLIYSSSFVGFCAKSKSEGVIEDVNGKGLAKLLEEKDYVAVFWCKLLTR